MSAHADLTFTLRKIYNINDTDVLSFKNVIFMYEFVHEFFFMYEFLCEFVKEFFMNFIHEFMYEICANSYEFVLMFCTKNWLCCEWPVLYVFPTITECLEDAIGKYSSVRLANSIFFRCYCCNFPAAPNRISCVNH